MTPDEISIAAALESVTFPPATSIKRFAESMIFLAKNRPAATLTDKQSRYLKQVAWKFRRQLSEDIVRLGLKTDTSKKGSL